LQRKTLRSFLSEQPCLEELEGFRDQRMLEKLWLDQDQIDYLTYKDRMERGREMPAPTLMPRAYVYKRGRKPKLKRGIRL